MNIYTSAWERLTRIRISVCRADGKVFLRPKNSIVLLVAAVTFLSGPALIAEVPTATPSATLAAKETAPDAGELTALLRQFLEAVPRNDPAMHDRFWADDLIYTRAAGVRIDKSELMRQIHAEAATSPSPETTVYSAEDVRVQQYGTTAIVAFRLVGTTHKGDQVEVMNYFNTGTFLKRDGKWQAVAWQATKIPDASETKK